MLGGYYTKLEGKSQGSSDRIDKMYKIGVESLCVRSVGRASGFGGLFSLRASSIALLASAVVLAYHIEGPTLAHSSMKTRDCGVIDRAGIEV